MDESFLKHLDYCFYIAKIIGLYQNGEPKRRYVLMGNLAWITSAGIITGCILQHLIQSKSLKDAVDELIFLLPALLFLIKLFNLFCRCKSLEKLRIDLQELRELASDPRFKKKKIVEKRLERMMKHIKFYLCNAYTMTIIIAVAIAIPKKLLYNAFNVNYEDNPIGFVFASLQIFWTSFYGNLALIVMNMTPLILLSYAIGFLNELAQRLHYICLNDEFEHDEIVQCVKIHQKIKWFVDEIKNIFGIAWLSQLLLSSAVIGFCVFTMTSSTDKIDFMESLGLATLMTFEIFLPCHVGEELIVASSVNLMDAIGHSHWPERKLNLKTRKAMLIFMESLKQPIEITFFNLIEMNLQTFVGIIDSAYSLYCIVSQLTYYKISVEIM